MKFKWPIAWFAYEDEGWFQASVGLSLCMLLSICTHRNTRTHSWWFLLMSFRNWICSALMLASAKKTSTFHLSFHWKEAELVPFLAVYARSKKRVRVCVSSPTAVCWLHCQNGGVCQRPNTCSCPEGWMGRLCEERKWLIIKYRPRSPVSALHGTILSVLPLKHSPTTGIQPAC